MSGTGREPRPAARPRRAARSAPGPRPGPGPPRRSGRSPSGPRRGRAAPRRGRTPPSPEHRQRRIRRSTARAAGFPSSRRSYGHEDAVAHPHPLLEPEAFPGGQLPDVGEPRIDRLAVRHREDPGEAGGSALRDWPLPTLRDHRARHRSASATTATIRCLAMSIPPVDECRAPERGSSEPARRMSQGIAPAAGGPHRSASPPRRTPRQTNQDRAARRGFAPVTRRAAVRRTPEARVGEG